MESVETSRKHFYISLVKSCVRGMSGGALIGGNLALAGVLLIAAEVLGVAEEL